MDRIHFLFFLWICACFGGIAASNEKCGGKGKIYWVHMDGCYSTSCSFVVDSVHNGSIKFEPAANHQSLTFDIVGIQENTGRTTNLYSHKLENKFKAGTKYMFNFSMKFLNEHLNNGIYKIQMYLSDGKEHEICSQFLIQIRTPQTKIKRSVNICGLGQTKNCISSLNTGTSVGVPCVDYNMPCAFPNSNCLASTPNNYSTLKCQCDLSAKREGGDCKKMLGTVCEDDAECIANSSCIFNDVAAKVYKYCACPPNWEPNDLGVCKSGSTALVTISFVFLIAFQGFLKLSAL